MRVHRPDGHWPDALCLEGLGTSHRAQFRLFTEDSTEVRAMIATYGE